MKRIATVAIVAALTAGGLVGGTSARAAAEYLVDDGPRFSLPSAAKGRSDVHTDQYSDSATELKDHLVDLISNTAAGQTIRISLYGWDDWAGSTTKNPTSAIVSAVRRGVNVKILLDAGAKLDADYTTISREMAGKSGSFIRRCGVGYAVDGSEVTYGRACIGTKMNHSKYFLFSKVGGSSYVVVQSTGHVTPTWGNSHWDASMTVVGKKALYDGYVKYFNDQATNTKNATYYRTVTDGNYKAYFFPRAGNEDYTTGEDTIYGVLNNVTCTGNTTVGTSTAHRTIIRIAQWQITRAEVAKKLRALADQNCWIDIATNMDLMGSGAKSWLKGHDRINVDNGNIAGYYIHAKYLLIEGNYDGDADSKNIWVGSPNLTYPALKENDETLMKIKSASGAWHDDFRENFRNIMAVSVDATWIE